MRSASQVMRLRHGSIRLFAGCAIVLAVLAVAPRPAAARMRVAVTEFKVEGDDSPTLVLQLQDGFILGLVRTGTQVLDPTDVAKRIETAPELSSCDSSPCLKRMGKLIDARFVLRVRVQVAGNSYKMVARVFSTEGSAPAALPLATKSRFCDVCTVTEAREVMLRLGDDLKTYLEEPAPPPRPRPVPLPPPPPPVAGPLVAAMVGGAAMAAGLALMLSMNSCEVGAPDRCDDNRTRAFVAGTLLGAGLVTTTLGIAITASRFGKSTVMGVNLRF